MVVRQDLTALNDQVEQLFIVTVGIIYLPPDQDPVAFIEIVRKIFEK